MNTHSHDSPWLGIEIITISLLILYFLNGRRVNPSLGGTNWNHFKKWLRNQKQPNHFSGPFLKNVFHNYKLLLFHIYPLHVLIYGLNFIWE